MNKKVNVDQVKLGVCYYPEHWEEALWEDDLKRMKALGFTYVRIGEFAWSLLEPEEGVFNIGYFDKVCELADQNGLKIIMGTPTATPPAWLTQKYPEVLNVTMEGVQYQHGQRRHYNYSTKIYQQLCERITRKMAEHYKNHPAIEGWQIDNELNCETNVFYAEADHAAFREWLKQKYETLEKLNEVWGTVFWSQTYTSWSQVFLSRPTVSNSPNPHLALDEKRFISDNTIAFAKIQADVLREVVPNHWVTTNGLFGHLDSHKLTNELLDFFSYDSYPQFSAIYPDAGERPLLDRKWGMKLSISRSISSNFCVMEQQSGPGGWVNRLVMPSPEPGQMRLWTYQSIAHGADMVVYFRWRTATVGTEIYWHGINDYHNQPNRRVAEASQVGAELSQVGSFIAGKSYQAKIALLSDYANEWDGELDEWFGPLISKSEMAWYKALQYAHIPLDYLYLQENIELEDLMKYEVLVYPHGAVMKEETANLFKRYVEQGGTMIFGARTGYKDEYGRCRMELMPGPVAGLCGVIVEEYTVLNEHIKPSHIYLNENPDQTLLTEDFNDVLKVQSDKVEIIATYKDKHYREKPALTSHSVGKGKALYYGAAFSEEIVNVLVNKLDLTSPISELCDLPAYVEVAIRSDAQGEEAIFFLNYKDEPVQLTFKKKATNKLDGQPVSGTYTLEAYGVMVLEFS